MSETWEFGYLLPQCAFREPIEGAYLAIVPPGDSRLAALVGSRPVVKTLVESFSDQFGDPVSPSALLVRSDAPTELDAYVAVSFRNVVAMSCIIEAWCCDLFRSGSSRPRWSDYFDFYPFTAPKQEDKLVRRSMEIVHLDGRLAKFSGQHAPHLQTPEGMSFGHDKYVLDACLAEWKRRFVRGLEEWRTGVLFRSLEVAFQAARLPGIGSRTPTMHDIGVNLALWVSALEILCHPPHENVGRDEVLDVLRRVEWDNQELAAEEYVLHGEKKRKGKNLREKRGNFIQKLCVELYRARNDFLHGNKVREDRLFLDGRTDFPPLVCCAPLIYRAALTGVLPEPPAPRGPEVRTAADADLLRRLNLGGYEEAVRECQKLTRSPNE